MPLFTKKLRPADELMKDPDFHHRVGRLVGASEMAGHVLGNSPDPTAQLVGEQLSLIADWFFVLEKVNVKQGSLFAPVNPPEREASEADTRITPPRK